MRVGAQQTSAVSNVHRDFHAEPEINGLRSFPFHKVSFDRLANSGQLLPLRGPSCAAAAKPETG
jgi:hypothetical protein